MIDLEQVLPVEDVRELELSGPFEEIRKFEDGIKLGHRYEGGTILEFDATEVERFKEVIELFESLDDEEIGIQTELISKKLPNFFSGLRAVDDDEFHGEGTLMDHTLTVLVGLNTDGLSRSSKKIIRTAALFHDMGKLVSMDAEHPRHSELLSREFLSQLNLDENELALLLRQIKYHEALGDISRRDGFSIWRPADLATFFKDCEELELHRRLVISDIGSIPSLRKYLPSVNSTYNRLVKQISVEGWKYLGSESLEFCDYGELLELRKKLYTDRDVDLIDVVEDMAWRRDLFKTVLTDEERRKVEDYIVHGSKAFDEGYMLAMQIAGIETNLGEIHNLGEKYKVSLEEAEMTAHVFSMTYEMWRCNYLVRRCSVRERDGLNDELEKRCAAIYEHGLAIKDMVVDCTHVSTVEGSKAIKESRVLYKSDGGDDYMGNGPYVGVGGSYSDWEEGDIFRFKIRTGAAVPTIVSFNYPQMMMVVMGEILDFREKGDVATPHGIIEWRQDKWIDDEVASVQIAVLEKTLGAKVSRIKDDFGRVCFTADTEVPPIVWGSLSHALKIWRFIPEIELPWAVNELLYDRWVRSRSGKELRIVGGISSLDDDQEEGDEFEVRYRIRGRFSRDKK